MHTRVMRLLVAAELAGNSRALMQPVADSFYATRACETKLVGQSIGPYTITERIGGGGMAEVYKAFHTELSVYRALKVIRPEFSLTPDFRTRFQKEARSVASLRHPNIVQVHDFGTHDNSCYMVMEFIEGEDLRRRLRARGQIRPIQEAVDLVVQVANALEYAHARGLIHRDIKPENIMITPSGQPILTDFGIAKILTGPTQLTQTGGTIGTPAYMAPEQALAPQDIGPPVDVYALTIVLFELLTGRTPYEANTPIAAILKAINAPLPMPRSLASDIGEALQSAIIKGAAKDVARRFQSVASLRDALIEAVQNDARSAAGESTPVRTSTRIASPIAPRGGRKRHFLIIGALASGFILAVLNAYISSDRSVPEPASVATSHASIAVLPFIDLSPAKDNEYFSDGISEELLSRLAKVKRFRVTGRTSSFAFKGKDEDLRTIGAKLGVESILEGSVRKQGDRIRITAQLVSVRDGSHVWSDTYDRRLNDVFEIQDDIAREVVTALRRTLLADSDAATLADESARRPTSNVAAYNSYLRGQYLLRKRIGKEMEQALDEFQRAVTLDSKFAQAHVGVASSLTLLASKGYRNVSDVAPQAKAAIARALELDPDLAEAYAAKRLLLYELDEGAPGERLSLIERAVALNPNDAITLLWLGHELAELGRPKTEVIRAYERAYAIDPLAPNIVHSLAYDLYEAGDKERARALAEELAVLTLRRR